MKKLFFFFVLIFIITDVSAQVVAFLDQGINTNKTRRASSKIIEQRCLSFADFLTGSGSSTARIEEASLCKNGQRRDFTGNRSAEIPRRFNKSEVVDTLGASIRHGNDVSNAMWDFSTQVYQQPFQIFGIKRENFSGGVPEGCHSAGNNQADCYKTDGGGNMVEALDRLAFSDFLGGTEELSAVSISVVLRDNEDQDPVLCQQKIGQGAVDRLHRNGIPVVVALLNEDLIPGEITWPQCLNHVIKVGSNNVSSNGIGVGSNGINFFAKGTIDGQSGNSLAAPRVAAAYGILHGRYPFSTVEEKTNAIISSASFYHSYNIRVSPTSGVIYRRRDVRKTHMPEALRILGLSYPTPPSQEEIIAGGNLDILDTRELGPRYGESDSNFTASFDLGNLRPELGLSESSNVPIIAQTQNQISLSGKRDITIQFTGSNNPSRSTSFRININGATWGNVSDFYTPSGTTKTVYIHRRFLRSGQNTIVIEPRFPSNNWGLTDISIKFAPVVPLTVGVNNPNQYGYDDAQKRFTGLRAQFPLANINADYQLSLTGWDMDVPDESRVFINGEPLAYVSWNPNSSEYSARDTFLLPRSLLRTGTNYVEMVQRTTDSSWTGYQDEKWAVKDIHIQIARPNLVANSMELIDKTFSANVPFQTRVTVDNFGFGGSNASTARFYLSTDQNITSSDTLLGTAGVSALNPGQSRVITKSLSTSLVNQGYYIGVCVDVVANEIAVGDNCSDGVPLKSMVNVAPIIMLLLNDD